MCGCWKVLETGVFISCLLFKTPGPGLDPGCWGQAGVLLTALALGLAEATELPAQAVQRI